MARPTTKPAPIHFTHHLCMASLGTDAKLYEHDTYSDVFSGGLRLPKRQACWGGRRGKRTRWSLSRDEVTCHRCLERLDEDGQEQWTAQQGPRLYNWERTYADWWIDDDELTKRSWFTCCRKQGIPWPAEHSEMLDYERWIRSISVRRVAWSLWVSLTPGIEFSGVQAQMQKAFAKLDAADRALLAPMFAEAAAADELLLAALQKLEAIDGFFRDVATRVRSRARVAVPEVA